ncbi:MAG: hypothetical protein JW759_03725 [Candidatus Coatesbacteria bacterium]|nr:hypothetical protein [Candidatus Coatesbacteria bacterium]
MKCFAQAFVLLLVIALVTAAAYAQEEQAEKAIKYKVGLKGFAGSWDFESSQVWHKGITGRYDMTSHTGPFGPFAEVSFAKDRIGLGLQYLVGTFDGEYHVRNNRYVAPYWPKDWYKTDENGRAEARRDDLELVLRLTPYFRYASLLFGYKWLKYYNFDRRGHGVWTEYEGVYDVPAGVHEYDMTHEERDRLHGFLYGLAFESPSFSGFYAWANGTIMPNLNIKYACDTRYRFDDPSIPDGEDSYCFSGRVKSFKAELGLAYACTAAPLELKVGCWLQQSKPDEDKAKNAPVFNDKLTGAAFSVAYTF